MTDEDTLEYLNSIIASWPEWKKDYEPMILNKTSAPHTQEGKE